MPQPEKYLSVSDYLAAEEQSSVKQEYHNGLLVDMAGGSIDYNRIPMQAIYSGLDSLTEPQIPFDL